MMNLKNFIGLFLVSLLFFTACKKDSITPTTNSNVENPPTVDTPISNNIPAATQTRAMAAATLATSRNNENNDTTFNDCGCYDLFDGIDIDASHDEVEAAVDSILAGLTEEQITHLFEPVCTDDGEIYESACIADCEAITNYHICSEAELEDYFFGGFDCEDLENLTFPAEIELPDGTLVTVNSEEELFSALENWFDTHGEEWEDEYGEEDYLEDCFTIIFPVQVQFPDGTVISYDTEEDLYASVDAWYEANPDSEADPLPVYPIEVMLEDSSTIAVNSEEELDALWESCYDLDLELCFNINYPVTLLYPDGATAEVNSDEELEQTIDAFYENSTDPEADIDVQYPVNITLSDGTVQAINNEDELEEALFTCFEEAIDGVGRLAPKSKKSIFSTKSTIQKVAKNELH